MTSLDIPLEKWKPFGSDRWAMARYPEAAYLIDPQTCIGLPGVAEPKDK